MSLFQSFPDIDVSTDPCDVSASHEPPEGCVFTSVRPADGVQSQEADSGSSSGGGAAGIKPITGLVSLLTVTLTILAFEL